MARFIHHVLALLFAAGCVCWLFFEPYEADRVARAIPAGSMLVTRHEDLGSRWQKMMQNPVVSSTLLGMGMSEADLDRLAADQTLGKRIKRLAGRQTMTAYVPSMGLEGEPTWLVSSWVGGAGYRLRALLSVVPMDAVEKLYRHNGRQVLKINYGGEVEDPSLTVCITEGVLIASYSRDAYALQDALDYFDGVLAGLSRIPRGPLVKLKDWARDYADCGYTQLPYTSAMVFRLDTFNERRIRVDMMTRGIESAQGPLDVRARNGSLGRLVGDIPLGMTSLPLDLAAEVLMNRTQSDFPQILGTLFANVEGEMATLALLGGDYRGSLQNIKVPVFLLAVQIPDRQQAEMLAEGLRHQANGFKDLGLVAKPVENAAHPVFTLESLTRRPYNHFPREDLVAYAMVDDLLVLCSNFGVLNRLVERYDTRVADFEKGQGEWLREFDDRKHHGFLWMNAARSGKAVKETLTAWSLSLLFEADAEERSMIRKIDAAKEWVDRLMHLETVRAWHTIEDGDNHLRVELGPR